MKQDELDLRQALDYIDPRELSYSEWVGVGMGLKEAGYPVGLWEDWSRRDGGRYRTGECARKGDSFRGTDTPITAGTIVQMAQRGGWQPNGGDCELGWDDEIGGNEPYRVIDPPSGIRRSSSSPTSKRCSTARSTSATSPARSRTRTARPCRPRATGREPPVSWCRRSLPAATTSAVCSVTTTRRSARGSASTRSTPRASATRTSPRSATRSSSATAWTSTARTRSSASWSCRSGALGRQERARHCTH